MKCAILSVAVIGVSLGRAAAAPPEELARKARDVFATHCHRCHGKEGTNEGGFNYVLDRQRLVQRRKIVPGDPAKSRLFRRLSSADDPMPPAEEKERPGAADVA